MVRLRTAVEMLAHRPFTFLLATLVFVLVIAPATEGSHFSTFIFTFAMTTVYVAGTIANRNNKYVFVVATIIAALAIPVSWSSLLFPSQSLDIGQSLIVILFCGMTAVIILLSIVRSQMSIRQALIGAICVYLLIGLTWAMIFHAIETVDPHALAFAARRTVETAEGEATSFSQLTYFSFVTMSTLGYGDITPRSQAAETACWTEAVVGQLYITILIARLVSVIPVPELEKK